jgi:hypothetical protein
MRKIIFLLLSVTSMLSVFAQLPTTSVPNILVNGGTTASNAAIASTAPASFKLSVQGNTIHWGTGVNTVTSPTLYFRNTTATTGRIWALNSDNTGIFTISDAVGTTTPLTHTSRFIINAAGNMGVGTISNPTTFTSLINLGSTAVNSKLAVWDNGTIKSGFGWGTGQLRMHLSAATDKFSFLGTEAATTDLMTILGTGNVGIGVAAPAQKLDVAGTVKSTGLIVTTGTPAANKFLTSTDAAGTATWSTTLNVPNGGTGLIAATAPGDMWYADIASATAFTKLPIGTANQVLTVSSTTLKPVWATASAGGTATNISYTASPTNGTIASSTGTSGTILPADAINSGLFLPAEKTKLTAITGTNTGDNAANTTYANDYRLANFVAGTNYLAPNGIGSALTGITASQVGAQPLNTNLTSIGALANGAGVLTNNGAGVFSYVAASAATNYWTATGVNIANNTTGNVGIGTGATAPATKLDVNGAITTNGGLLMKSGAVIQLWNATNGNYGEISSYDGGGFKMRTGALKEFSILNSGNVGIGVATPTSLLHLPISGTIAIGTPDVSTTEGAALSSSELRFRTNTNYNTSLAAVPGAYELQVLDKNNSTLGGIKANIAKVNSIYSTNNFVVANVLDGQLKVGGQAYGGTPFYVKENSVTTDVHPSMIIEAGKSSAAAANVPLSLHLKPVINTDNVTTGISFGGNNIGGVDQSNTSQAGIYVRSSNVQGTTMKFATTNNYGTAAQMRMTIDPIGNVGIGTETPTSNAKLDIVGKIKITDGSQGVNKVLTSDASGLASWADIPVTVATTTAWGLLGNTNATASSFLGTALNTDFDLIFKRNGVLSGKLNSALALTTFGVSAGLANTTGINNTFLGTASGATNTTGEKNTGLGVQSLLSNISGNNNTAIGVNTLRSNTSGSRNLAIGYDALYGNTTGTDNIAIGLSAGSSITSGIKNIILGSPSATSPTNLTQGSYNTIIGSDITGISPTLSNNIILADGQGNRRINVNELGNVGIGVSTVPNNYKLAVAGAIIATKVTVKIQANWPDYVFNKNYELPSLQSVESFIKTNNHLPGVPSAEEVKEKGIDLGDNQTILLKKVEELTLYIIDQDKKIVKLQAEKDELKNMQKQIDELKAMLLKK